MMASAVARSRTIASKLMDVAGVPVSGPGPPTASQRGGATTPRVKGLSTRRHRVSWASKISRSGHRAQPFDADRDRAVEKGLSDTPLQIWLGPLPPRRLPAGRAPPRVGVVRCGG
jgi:hypothetical protein